MSGQAALQMEDVSVGYGRADILRGVSLTIGPGETHCLLGVNGSGKTTLIRTALGRIKPRSGRVLSVSGGVGLVPQEIALFPRLTVAENLSVFARLGGLARSQISARVQETVEATGLNGRQDAIVATLSGGWQRRVNIASAILHRPALLILDEPTVGVDVAARADLHGMIRNLAADGMGILMTTHDLSEAEVLCSHAAMLAGGRIVAHGPLHQLLVDRFAARLLLSLAFNTDPDAEQGRRLTDLGFTLSQGTPVLLVEDDRAGLTAVETVRAAGLGLRGFSLERPGLAHLYRTLGGDAR